MSKVPENRIVFRLDAFEPNTLPSIVLAEYLSYLALMIGHETNLHFQRLGKGSAKIIQFIDRQALQEARQRIIAVGTGTGPEQAMIGYRRLQGALERDGAKGTLRVGTAKLLTFPASETAATAIGPIRQQGYLDGQLIRIGGRDETVPCYLRDGEEIYKCTTTVELARKLGVHLYGPTLRVSGTGQWTRLQTREWNIDRFTVESFVILDDTPLNEILPGLRAVPDLDWPNDPLREFAELRHG